MPILDLSVPLEASPGEPVPVQMEITDHAAGADILGAPAGLDRSAFPDGLGLSLEHVRLISHAGTHVDAPAHYGPLCEGRPARTVDQLPLSWFFGPGVLLDVPGTLEDGPVRSDEIAAAITGLGGRGVRQGDIVLIRTGADRLWGRQEYFTNFRGVSLPALDLLLDAGIKVIGVDSFGFDPPFHSMLDSYSRTRNPDVLWPAHIHGRRREYCQIERLAHLDQLPLPHGFQVACFPINLRGAGAAWVRAVAILPDELPS